MPKFVYRKQNQGSNTTTTNSTATHNDDDDDDDDDDELQPPPPPPLQSPSQTSLQASLLNMFTGGIFFSSALLHFLPDATDNEEMKEFLARLTGLPDDYPYAMLLTAIGFFLLLSVEALVHEWNASGAAGLEKCCCCCFGFLILLRKRRKNRDNLQDDLLSSEHSPQNHGNSTALHALSDHEANVFNDNTMNDNTCPENTVNGGNDDDDDDDISYESQGEEGQNLLHDNMNHHNDVNNNYYDNQEKDINSSTIVSLVVFLSLSIHSFMAGLGKIFTK